ncbi:MAG: PqqD family protein [Victivallales bacterium]|nr:PqqD family protein [Victivallales bacterium]
MDEASRISSNSEIEFNYLDGNVVMMNVENGNYYNLNKVGSAIWDMLDNGALTVGELADRIINRFNVSRDIAVRDIIAFAENGEKQGIVVSG